MPNSAGNAARQTLGTRIESRLSRVSNLPGRCSSTIAASRASAPGNGITGRGVPAVASVHLTRSRSV